jgi:hypothetical protein
MKTKDNISYAKCFDTKICQNVRAKILVFKGKLSKDADGSVYILI